MVEKGKPTGGQTTLFHFANVTEDTSIISPHMATQDTTTSGHTTYFIIHI
jgi:hypothetical protein